MKLRTVKTVFFCLTIVGFLLYLPARALELSVLLVIAAVCFLAALIIQLIFWKCPACGRHLGRGLWAKYCKYCGKELDIDE